MLSDTKLGFSAAIIIVQNPHEHKLTIGKSHREQFYKSGWMGYNVSYIRRSIYNKKVVAQ